MTSTLARRRRASLPERLAALESVLELGQGRLDEELMTRVRALLDRAGHRLRLSGEHTVVALAGATGSGKSSLFNALAQAPLSPVEVRRPTTAVTHAAVWGDGAATGLLDWLAVPERHHRTEPEPELDGLVLLDLPDHDSTQLEHRAEVDRLVEAVDLFVWVLDPQKYADAAVHDRYLRRLSSHAGITLVVLNQLDTLAPAGLRLCLDDLRALLDAGGLDRARLLATSAVTGDGIDTLRTTIGQAVRRRAAASDRLSADLDAMVVELTAAIGTGEASRVPRAQAQLLTSALAEAGGVPAIADAVERAVRERTHASTGWPLTRWVHRVRRDPLRRLGLSSPQRARPSRTALPAPTPAARAQVDVALREVAEASAATLPPPWRRSTRAVALARRDELVTAIGTVVARTDLGVSRRPWWVRLLSALQWALALTTIVGVVWLTAALVADWLALPELPTYPAGGLPLPTLLLLVGVAGGLALALLGSALARSAGRRAGRRVARRLRQAISRVAGQLVIEPVAAEASTHSRLADAVARVGGR